MQNFVKTVLIGTFPIGLISLSGCATSYKAPSDPAQSASAEVYKGYKTGVGFGTGTQQEYSIYTNDQCNTPQRLASFTWTNGEKKNKLIGANTPLRIGASTNYFSPGEGGYWNGTAYVSDTDVNSCLSYAKFTPQPGAKYKIIQSEGADKSCSLEVTNLETGQAPTDLVVGLNETCAELDKNELD